MDAYLNLSNFKQNIAKKLKQGNKNLRISHMANEMKKTTPTSENHIN